MGDSDYMDLPPALREESNRLPKRAPPSELAEHMGAYSFNSPSATAHRSPLDLNLGHMPPRFRLAQSPVNAASQLMNASYSSTQKRLMQGTKRQDMKRCTSQPTLGSKGSRRQAMPSIGVPFRIEAPGYMNLPKRRSEEESEKKIKSKKDMGDGSESGLEHRRAMMAVQDCAYRANACRRAGRTTAEANAYLCMGVHYDSIGEFLKAIRCYMQAIQTLEGVVTDFLVTNLAYNCTAISLYRAGPKYFPQAIHYNQLHLDNAAADGKFAAFTNLGLIFCTLGQVERAADCHKDALRCALKLKSVPKQAIAIGNLGLSGYKHGDYSTAEACMERHLQLSKTLGDTKGRQRAAQVLGEIANRKRNYGKATGYFKESMILSKNREDNRAAASAKVQLGVALAQSRMDAHMKTVAKML